MAIDPAIAAILGLDSGGEQQRLADTAKAANLLAQNTPGAAGGLNPSGVVNALMVNETSVAAFEKMLEGSVAAQSAAADYASRDQKKFKKATGSSGADSISISTDGADGAAGADAVSDPSETSQLYAQNAPGSGARQRGATSLSPQNSANSTMPQSPVIVSVGSGKAAKNQPVAPPEEPGHWPPYVSSNVLVNPNNILRDITNLTEGNGGVENPANVFRAQVMLMQAEVQWDLMSQIAAKGVSGIQTLFSNQI